MMNVIGHGIDVVDRERFESVVVDVHQKHLLRYFTEKELSINDVNGSGSDGLAKRLAAKEAVMKALEHGFGDGLAFTDIEITKHESGKPQPVLHRKAKEIEQRKGIKTWFLSVSSTRGIATASAIACG